jgi:hypothetical protein
MTTRSLFLGLGLAAAGFMLIAGLPAPSYAAPGVVLKPSAEAELVQEAGYYKRRWRSRNETYVRAPFARVYSGRRGTWVRAPFVNLWVPR